ncbi:MAG: universal stress protein [Candidatus Bipolaricaulia bacterium]
MLKINILVTVSSEYFSEAAIRRAAMLNRQFEGELTLLYIIEEKMLRLIDRVSEYAMTTEERVRAERNLVKEIKGRAEGMLFERAAVITAEERSEISSWRIEQGEYTRTIQEYCKANRVDLIVMSFERATLLNYEILKWPSPSIWIEKGTAKALEKILALPSNLTLNRTLPEMAVEFARRFDAQLHIEYVVDRTHPHTMTKEGKIKKEERSEAQLIEKGEAFLRERQERYEKTVKLSTSLSTGRLERKAIITAREWGADLIILGRELEVERTVLGLFRRDIRRDIRREIVSTSPCSVLLIK